jgi:hypothetical protein
MQTVEEFINALGGTVAVAQALGIAPTTVSSWKSAGSVPKWRMAGLEQIAMEKNIGIPASFVAIDTTPNASPLAGIVDQISSAAGECA